MINLAIMDIAALSWVVWHRRWQTVLVS